MNVLSILQLNVKQLYSLRDVPHLGSHLHARHVALMMMSVNRPLVWSTRLLQSPCIAAPLSFQHQFIHHPLTNGI